MLNVNLSLNQTLLTFLLYVTQTWMTKWFWQNFCLWGYLPLTWNDSTTHIHGLAVYVKQELPFARALTLENSADSYVCFKLASLWLLSSFSSMDYLLCLQSYFFDSTSSNIDEVLSINPSANVFVFGDFN